jgi:SAM-dependent methyltransferase
MTNLPAAPSEPFDAVVCLFDSIGYVNTNDRIGAVLKGVHRQLRRDGLFVFEFWHAAAMLRGYDPVRVRRWQTANGEVMRISETELDCARQLSHVTYSIYDFQRTGDVATLTETQTNRYFLVQEMCHWLSCTGFVPVRLFAGFSEDESIKEDTWHVVAVARRVEAQHQ